MSEVLTTPAEVAAFLADRVMGWELGSDHDGWQPGVGLVLRPDGRGWDPWRNVGQAIEALETFVCPYQAHHYAIHTSTMGDHTVKLYHSNRSFGVAHGRQPIAPLACRALCSAHGAEVRIEEEAE